MTPKPIASVTVSLPVPPDKYDEQDQAELRRVIALAFTQTTPRQPRQTVTGAKGGNAALASLITALANLGFVTDSTT